MPQFIRDLKLRMTKAGLNFPIQNLNRRTQTVAYYSVLDSRKRHGN